MTEKNAWDIEQLKKEASQEKKRVDDHETRLRAQESFRDSTVEKLIVIFDRLEELQEGDRFIKRAITTSLITAIVGAIGSFIAWAISN